MADEWKTTSFEVARLLNCDYNVVKIPVHGSEAAVAVTRGKNGHYTEIGGEIRKYFSSWCGCTSMRYEVPRLQAAACSRLWLVSWWVLSSIYKEMVDCDVPI